MGSNENCFICHEKLDGSGQTTVRKKGIETLLRVSKIRDDGKVQFLRNVDEIVVHTLCRNKYSKTSGGYFCYKEFGSKIVPTTSNGTPLKILLSPKKKNLRKSLEAFDFGENCFICGEKADTKAESKKRPNKRRKIFNVKNPNFKATLLGKIKLTGDEQGKCIHRRIVNEDLVAKKAKYHENCAQYYENTDRVVLPYPENSFRNSQAKMIDNYMEKIYQFIEDSGDNQFTLSELVESAKDAEFIPCLKTVKQRIQDKFQDSVRFQSKAGDMTLVCFGDAQYNAMKKSWESKNKNIEEKRNKVLSEALAILRNDILHFETSITHYPPCEDMFNNASTYVPETLNKFIDALILTKKKGKVQALRPLCDTLKHIIVSAIRPRSFLSGVKLGLGVMLHRKFASRLLVDIFSTIGVTCSYDETVLYQHSLMKDLDIEIFEGAFAQFVFDNADFNINTLDGNNTFHSMGGIKVVTPANKISTNKPIKRLRMRLTAQEVENIGKIPFMIYENSSPQGYNSIKPNKFIIEDFGLNNLCNAEILWLFAKHKYPNVSGWNGFMGSITKDLPFDQSRVLCTPFINSTPSDLNTIYTALSYAASEAKQIHLHTIFVTFDQPLFQKATEIVKTTSNEEVSKIIVRLGGFHLLMSYLGCIGYIMDGSGLKDVLETCYAPASIDKMLNGHAYSRAIRGLNLVYTALMKRIFNEIDCENIEKIEELLATFNESPPSHMRVEYEGSLQKLGKKILEKMKEIEGRGKTAKLWIQFIKMEAIAKNFIRSEKMGDMRAQIQYVLQMIPIFYAAGHLNYAKSAHLYVQEMTAYISKMDKLRDTSNITEAEEVQIEEFKQFIDKGFCTIRRTNKYWSGNFSDMTIEQDLMRVMKVVGGLTSRGFDESIQSKWIATMPFTNEICEQAEKFCQRRTSSSDQHVDARDTRIKRDNNDIRKISEWFDLHEPFPFDDEIKCLASGVVGEECINCHEAFRIGKKLFENTCEGVSFAELKLSRKSRVLPLKYATSTIRTEDDVIIVDPTLIFQRICVTKESNEQLREYLRYELAPYPTALFHEGMFRKNQKCKLVELFEAEKNPLNPQDCIYVIDGGMLLHKVHWNKNETFNSIFQSYISYIRNHFGQDVVVVFDGYNSVNSIKSLERQRRSSKKCADVCFEGDMTLMTTKDKFLSNSTNKGRFIQFLAQALKKNNIWVEESTDDADALIVCTALKQIDKIPVVVSEDTDVLALVVGLTSQNRECYFLKPAVRKSPQTLYSSRSLDSYPFLRDNILFLHCVGGGDTTSAIFGKGKKSILFELNKVSKSNLKLKEAVEIFRKPHISQEQIFTCGMICLLAIYKAPQNIQTLNDLRYSAFKKAVYKTNAVKLESLPPTEDAAKFHIFRAYLQTQKWLGNELNPTDWGWKMEGDFLKPVKMSTSPAPPDLLKMIFCNCKKGCGKACGCRKAGLYCSSGCGNCCADNCFNMPSIQETEETDEFNKSFNELDKSSNDSSGELHIERNFSLKVDEQADDNDDMVNGYMHICEEDF